MNIQITDIKRETKTVEVPQALWQGDAPEVDKVTTLKAKAVIDGFMTDDGAKELILRELLARKIIKQNLPIRAKMVGYGADGFTYSVEVTTQRERFVKKNKPIVLPEIIEVIRHDYFPVGSFDYRHTATVRVTGVLPKSEEARKLFTYKVAAKVGFPAAGYGAYLREIKKVRGENAYTVIWEGSRSCE